MFQTALPILGVSKSAAAEDFYCGQLGFRRAYVNVLDPDGNLLNFAQDKGTE